MINMKETETMKKAAVLLIAFILMMSTFCLADEAVTYVKTINCTPVYKGVDFSFDAPGHEMIIVTYKSSQESGQFLLAGNDGSFTGHLSMPMTYSGSNVYITLTSMNGRVLNEKYNTRTLVPEPEAGPRQEGRLSGITVCIDPGHSANCPSGSEPVGPGLEGRKALETGMAQGIQTRRMESVVNLEIAFVLRDVLLAQGANVVMTRTTESASLSNLDRCAIAEEGGADIMLRLHCNLTEPAYTTGIQIYAPKSSDYAKALGSTEEWNRWCDMMLNAMKDATGCKKGGTCLTNQYTGNNWAKMPCFLVEMGYMSNPGEDMLLSEPWYQQGLAEGMADGCYLICQDRGLLN